ncbi:hypothetical protein LbFV_ORF52 [Leptopilina boulardi filamentous virus]|uniref:Uncharacterized protein n=1 Tax=Leptopilina boulardi filamentous virus TaxID=552509 RepID=A0A1S5YD35_9VIRU|nr:hypothetical protein LbFV_ORF52 [Leptopilina boulardi filamentous virus]AQQ79972.1 hypothetical protein LbFV_ORF52 [Leptopilina boulardi filamentous virus]
MSLIFKIIFIYICIFLYLYIQTIPFNNISNLNTKIKKQLEKITSDNNNNNSEILHSNINNEKYVFRNNTLETIYTGMEIKNKRNCEKNSLFKNNIINNDNFSCSNECNNNGSEYYFKKIFKKKSLYYDSYKQSGTHCIKYNIENCNLDMNRLFFDEKENKYICLSKYNFLFGGKYGTKIITCNGKLIDRKENVIYHNYIPNDLNIIDIDEKIDNNTYRYECLEQKDLLNNTLINIPQYLRFYFMQNYCTSLIPNTSNLSLPNFSTSTCENSENYNLHHFNDNVKNPFSTCVSEFAENTSSTNKGGEYATSINNSCIGPGTPKQFWNKLHVPCSESALENGYCEKSILLATTTYSPLTLHEILIKTQKTENVNF